MTGYNCRQPKPFLILGEYAATNDNGEELALVHAENPSYR